MICVSILRSSAAGRRFRYLMASLVLAAFLAAGANAPAAKPGPTTRYEDMTEEQRANLGTVFISSPPHPRTKAVRPVHKVKTRADVLLAVPTSTWTYGCSATAAGMLFGYYDRHGFPNMYTGPTNGGVCPMTNLGQGANPSSPVSGACYIIATMNGFDGRSTPGHVDDYWVSYNSTGPDPWVGGGTEHTWGLCTADYMGTNQWKYDYSSFPSTDGTRDANSDGSTQIWFYTNGTKLYDFHPGSTYGTPSTSCSHGMRMFAESRGYTVTSNYNQWCDVHTAANGGTGGFTLADYRAEIDAGRPVLVHITGHTMTGVGYQTGSQTIYIHDTWDNSRHSMTWGGTYDSSPMETITVFQLSGAITTEDPGFESSQTCSILSSGQFFAAAYNLGGGTLATINTFYTGDLTYTMPDAQWVGIYVYDYASMSYQKAKYVYWYDY